MAGLPIRGDEASGPRRSPRGLQVGAVLKVPSQLEFSFMAGSQVSGATVRPFRLLFGCSRGSCERPSRASSSARSA